MIPLVPVAIFVGRIAATVVVSKAVSVALDKSIEAHNNNKESRK